MKETAYNQINPLIRLKETELLTIAQYEQLLQATTMEAVKDILKNTIYGTHLETDFEQNFEYVYSKEQGKLYEWLYEMAPEPEVVSLYTARFTFHNLKVLTKAEVTGKNFDHLFIFDGRYSLETLKSAVHTKMSTEVSEPIMAAICEVMDYLAESNLLQAIDIIYDRMYLTYERELADKLGNQDILREVTAFIDLTNISIMARGIVQRQTENFLSTVLSSSGSISKNVLLDFAEEPLSVFTDFLLTTKYSYTLSAIISQESKELDLVAFEKIKDDYLTGVYDKARVVAFGPLPLLAFLNAKEVEWKNLRLILIGRRSGFSVEQVRERMRLTDGA